MTEQFILDYVPLRIRQLDFNRYHLKHRDFIIEPGARRKVPAYNELFFIIGEPTGLVVDSDYGMYDSTDDPIDESMHVHRGEISIYNPGPARRRIQFIQVVIVE